MMKKLWLVPAAAALIASCSSKPQQTVLELNFPKEAVSAEKDQMVYLSVDTARVDSAQLSEHITLTAKLNKESLGLAEVQLGRMKLPVILDGDTVSVSFTDQGVEVKGGPQNTAYKAIEDARNSLIQEYRTSIKTIMGDSTLAEDAKLAKTGELERSITKQLDELIEKNYKEHKDDAIGAILLPDIFTLETKEASQKEDLYKLAGDKIKVVPSVKRAYEDFQKVLNTSAGRDFVDFKGVDDEGKEVAFSDYVGKGHYVLADFWASWCGPCRREIPNLVKVYNDFKDKGLVVLGVAVWDKMDDHLKAVKELGIEYPQIFNEREATDLYGIKGIPQIILFTPDGKVYQRDLRGEAIRETLDKILKEEGKL